MIAELSDEVKRVFQLVVRNLGETFSFEELVLFTSSCRGKMLLFEQRPMPVALSGYCLALRDVDLIITRAGLDEILTCAVKLHEIAHLLLRHLPALCYGPATPTYAAFHDHEQALVYRDHQYDDPREQDAELLGTLLLDCIVRAGGVFSKVARDVYGW